LGAVLFLADFEGQEKLPFYARPDFSLNVEGMRALRKLTSLDILNKKIQLAYTL